MSNMSLTRNLIRIGKPINVSLDVIKRYRTDAYTKDKMATWRTLSDIMLILYFITDHPFYF